MRIAKDLLDWLKANPNPDFKFWKDELKKNKNELFVGVRKEKLDVYYLGCRIAELSLNKKIPAIDYAIDPYYVGRGKIGGKAITFGFAGYKTEYDKYNGIKRNALAYAIGYYGKQVHREKVCQQWIVNQYNSNPDSNWYFTDIEYQVKGNPIGRMDMIAISRKPDPKTKKHRVALVELKVTNEMFKGIDGTEYRKKIAAYSALKANLYNPNPALRKIKFGSGIVSHIADFSRYLYNTANFAMLKTEIVAAIKAHKDFGLIDPKDPIISITEENIADKPEVFIVCYTCAPTMPDKITSLKALKQSMCDYLYKSKTASKYCLENMLNPADIKEILASQSSMRAMITNDSNNKIVIKHEINGIKYDFNFVFFEPSPWKCLD